jgi:hypothetical protein
VDEFKLKTKWFGLNRSDVSRHFRTTKRLQDHELEELKAEIERLERENAALRMAVDALPPVEKVTAVEASNASPVAEFAAVETERASDEIAAAEALPEAATVVAVEVTTALEAPTAVEVEERRTPDTESAFANATAATAPENAVDEESIVEETVGEPSPVFAEESPMLSPSVSEAPNEEIVAPALAADETASPASRSSNVVEFRRRVAEEPVQQPVPQELPKQEAAEVEPARKLAAAASMGFWGSANDVMEQVWAEAPSPIAFDEISAAAAPYAPPSSEGPKRKERKEESATEPRQNAAKPNPQASAPEAAQPPVAQPSAAAHTATSGEMSSVAISEEIRSLRSKYIAGKWAGEDLFDAAGKRIVAKGAVITDEDVEAADRAGKLAELIVNMVIPGLGE